ncbi:MAG TPA: hypothetical protein VF236_06455 [Gaiellaceae bacterium]
MRKTLGPLAISASTLCVALVGLIGATGGVAAGGVTASATGSGHTDALGGNRTFAFTARQYADGTDKGQLEINFHPGETSPIPHIVVQAEVDCLRVIGNVAIISGTVKHTNFPAFENVRGILSVQDNGEGGSAPPDLISGAAMGGGVIIVPPTSPLDCTNVMPPPNQSIDRGNVQVRSD